MLFPRFINLSELCLHLVYYLIWKVKSRPFFWLTSFNLHFPTHNFSVPIYFTLLTIVSHFPRGTHALPWDRITGGSSTVTNVFAVLPPESTLACYSGNIKRKSMTNSVVSISRTKLLNLVFFWFFFLEIMNILESSDYKFHFNACWDIIDLCSV